MYRNALLVIFFIVLGNRMAAQSSAALLQSKLPNTLNEVSGIVQTANGVFVVNDGASNTFFRVDITTGSILQKIVVSNIQFEDAEAITADETYIYIADIGNNEGLRQNLCIVKIPLKAIGNEAVVTVDGLVLSFAYDDQYSFAESKKMNKHDCEAFIVVNKKLYLFTKRRADNATKLYSLNTVTPKQTAIGITTFNSMGLITDAAYNATTKELLLLGYQKGHIGAFILKFTNATESNFFTPNASRFLLNKLSNDEWQTEGLCCTNDNNFLLTCEKAGSYQPSIYKLLPW